MPPEQARVKTEKQRSQLRHDFLRTLKAYSEKGCFSDSVSRTKRTLEGRKKDVHLTRMRLEPPWATALSQIDQRCEVDYVVEGALVSH